MQYMHDRNTQVQQRYDHNKVLTVLTSLFSHKVTVQTGSVCVNPWDLWTAPLHYTSSID